MSLYVKALRRAAEILGIDELSRHVGAGRVDVADWLASGNPPPIKVFLKAVDVIADHDVSALQRKIGA